MEAFPVEYGHFSHTGMRRANNQDNLAAVPAANETQFKSQGHLFLVADGMGGHLGGEKASELAVQIVPLTFAKNIHQGAALALRMALQDANGSIKRRGNEAIHFYNMGTTCSVLALREEGAWVGHVGDSRVYRIRSKNIDQITFDHSFLWETARIRKVPPERIKDVMQNKILRCLGPDQMVEVDIEGPHPLRPGDTFLLCSDGLSGPVGNTEMAQAAWLLSPQNACEYLVALANLRGGPDNITVQVIKLPHESPEENGASGAPFKFWPKLIDWSPWSLIPGVILAVTFFAMLIKDYPKGLNNFHTVVLVLASLFTVAGMAGLILRLAQKGRSDQAPQEVGKARIHRREPWALSRENIDLLAKQIESLASAAINMSIVQPVLPEVLTGQDQAKALVASNDLVGAFQILARLLPKLEPVIRASLAKQIPSVPMLIPRPGHKI